jgi:hypothetical protein
MFAKVACVLVAIGACGCSLLALRQQRLQVASELTRAQLRIQAADERLWELRAQIAARTTPEQIRELAVGIGAMKPLMSTPTAMPDQWRFAEGGGEVLPIVPRLNEPAGAPVSRVRQTPTPPRTAAVASRTPTRRESAQAPRSSPQASARAGGGRSEPTQVVQRTRSTRQSPSAGSGSSRRSAATQPSATQGTPSRSNRRDAGAARETPVADGGRPSSPASRSTARPSTSPSRVARTEDANGR